MKSPSNKHFSSPQIRSDRHPGFIVSLERGVESEQHEGRRLFPGCYLRKSIYFVEMFIFFRQQLRVWTEDL